MKLNEKQLHILSTALELFAENGYAATSVRAIADAANVNLSMISYYFGGKEGLMLALVSSKTDSMDIESDLILNDQTCTPFEKIEKLVEAIVDKFWQNREMYNIIIREQNFQTTDEIKEILSNLRIKRLIQFETIVKEGQKNKIFKSDINIPLMHANVIGMLKHIYFSGDYYYETLKIPNTPEKEEILLTHIKEYLKTIFKLLLNDNQK